MPGDHGPRQRATWVVVPPPSGYTDEPTYFIQVTKRDGNDRLLGIHFSVPGPPSEIEEVLVEREVDTGFWLAADYLSKLSSERKRILALLQRDTFLEKERDALIFFRGDRELVHTAELMSLIDRLHTALPERHLGRPVHFLD